MSRQKKDVLFWAIIVSILAGQGLLVWALLNKSTDALQAIGWITGAVIPAVMFLYSQLQKRSLRVFLFVNKIRGVFSTHAPTWNMSVTMKGEHLTDKDIAEIIRKLRGFRSATREVRVTSVNARKSIVSIENYPDVEIAFTPAMPSPVSEIGDVEFPYIQASIKNYHVGYAQASSVIRNEISPILESIASAVHDVETRYGLVINFDQDKNPFFGLYIANLPPQSISKFSIVLIVNNQGKNDTVSISETKIAINTRTQTALQGLALEFLTFGSGLQEHLGNV